MSRALLRQPRTEGLGVHLLQASIADPSRETLEGGIVEQRVQRKRDAHGRPHACQRDRARQRIATQGEEIVVGPDAVQADYIPDFRFRGGRTGNAGFYQTDRGPFTNENITWDALANLTKVWGSHSAKFGVYFQHSYKPQSIFASFNSQINFIDDSANPFDTGYSYANAATGVFNQYTQASKFALPEWRYKNFEWYAQDNWKVSRRLTLDYGVRFYYLTPQWDTTLQASNFLPDRFDPSQAARLFTPVCIGSSPCSGADRRAIDPALLAAGWRGDPATRRFASMETLPTR